MNLRKGQAIPLAFQLHDGDTTKYVRAVVRDSSDTPISGSPFSLPHESAGLYTNNSGVMPDTPFITVQYQAFTDAGFTTPSTVHSTVCVEIPRIDDVMLNGGEVVGVVDASPLVTGVVEASPEVVATVCECD
jgi:hypothetical protein